MWIPGLINSPFMANQTKKKHSIFNIKNTYVWSCAAEECLDDPIQQVDIQITIKIKNSLHGTWNMKIFGWLRVGALSMAVL